MITPEDRQAKRQENRRPRTLERKSQLSVTDLALILNGIDLATARRRKRYSRVG
jgi:hypothetical protein